VLLQDPEILYRIEIGTPTDKPNVFHLTSYEMASRLSFLLWGTKPADALFSLASNNRLATPVEVRAAAKGMLDGTIGGQGWGKRARDNVSRFHGLWLGYEYTTPETTLLGKSMRAETGALLERTIFEKRTSWFDVFTAKDTFVDFTLSTYY